MFCFSYKMGLFYSTHTVETSETTPIESGVTEPVQSDPVVETDVTEPVESVESDAVVETEPVTEPDEIEPEQSESVDNTPLPVVDYRNWLINRTTSDHVHYTGDALLKRLGHIRGTRRESDYLFSHLNFEMPSERVFSLRNPPADDPNLVGLPPVLDQGELGSCTANGMANCLRVCEMKENPDEMSLLRSRLFIYYYSRLREGNVDTDSGAEIRDVVKVVKCRGACLESEWPYDISQFTVEPTKECQTHARAHRAVQYESVEQNLEALKTAIRTGFPVVFGFVVYDSIQTPDVGKTGVIPMPTNSDKAIGGHCVILTGWDDNKRLFQIMNSWSDKWGDDGFGYLSYDYILTDYLASDFWRITYVS
jgi:C1A family cysteine protease